MHDDNIDAWGHNAGQGWMVIALMHVDIMLGKDA
jgi:hypothetical protein